MTIPSDAAPDNGSHARDLTAAIRLTPALGADFLEHAGVLPLRVLDGRVEVATWREVDEQVRDDLRLAFDAEPTFARYEERAVREAIQRLYGAGPQRADDVAAGLGTVGEGEVDRDIPLDDLLHLANEAPVVRLVNLLLLEALDARASDVHLEAYRDGLRVRYRMDGVLQDGPTPPRNVAAPLVSRIKVMADLDIAERRAPQDGRMRLRLRDRQVDVRVSTVPTLHGESIVLRLLDKEQGRMALEDLGMAAETLAGFEAAVRRPHGIVLATGPTGSGKTTTLYAAVDRIRTGREKIMTVEDPVEYELPGVPQVPVHEKAGVTFATALRALLRQDPDVMLVGEIRDADTAEIATQAALTGHLVLSTLHTNDAATALTRLLDLGVAPYLVASTVHAVLAQRLVRVLCTQCRIHDPGSFAELGLDGSGRRTKGTRVHRAGGCDACRGVGYRGRVGIYELLPVDDAIRTLVLERRSAAEIRAAGVAAGMRTLRDDGARLVAEGVTSVEEVLRVTRD
jgi:general secretion pathway protein E